MGPLQRLRDVGGQRGDYRSFGDVERTRRVPEQPQGPEDAGRSDKRYARHRLPIGCGFARERGGEFGAVREVEGASLPERPLGQRVRWAAGEDDLQMTGVESHPS